MSIKSTARAVLYFKDNDGNLCQHSLRVAQAWYLARDLGLCGIEAHVFPQDEYGRRISLEPIQFDDIDFNN